MAPSSVNKGFPDQSWLRCAAVILLLLFVWPVLLIQPTWLLANILIFGLLSFIYPVVGLYGLALIGPLYLRDPGSYMPTMLVDATVFGIVLRWIVDPRGKQRRLADFGFWPYLLIAFFLVLVGSLVPSILSSWYKDDIYTKLPHLLDIHAAIIIDPVANRPVWGMRFFFNMMMTALLACGIATRLSPLEISRFMKLAAVSLVVSLFVSLFGVTVKLFPFLGEFNMHGLRRDHLEHGRRLQGPSGHPGWYAQWFVLATPAVLLFFQRGRLKLNILAACILLFCLCGLVLTAARAGWMAAMAGALLLAILYRQRIPYGWKGIAAALIAAALVAGGAILLGGEVVQERVLNLFRATDRLRYYLTSWAFLQEYPLGIGLGQHAEFYATRVTWFYPYWQFDHVDAHSLYLNFLVETGALGLLLLLGLLSGVLYEGGRAFRYLEGNEKRLMAVLLTSFVGMLIVCLFQHVSYLRIIEVMLWFVGAAIVAVARRVSTPPIRKKNQWISLVVLAFVYTAITAIFHFRRDWPAEAGRPVSVGRDLTMEVWTRDRFRTIVDQRVRVIRFNLYRIVSDADVEIIWPNGDRETLTIGPEQWMSLRKEFPAREVSVRDRLSPQWLELRVSPTIRPIEHLDDVKDRRDLGVYISGFVMEYEADSESQ